MKTLSEIAKEISRRVWETSLRPEEWPGDWIESKALEVLVDWDREAHGEVK